jgi:hypothetical protein
MSKTTRLVCLFLVASRAHALIVVDQVLTRSRVASLQWTVWDILAGAHTCCGTRYGNVLFEATIADTLEILQVIANRVGLVLALSVRAALVVRRETIIVVLALCWVQEGTIGLACNFRPQLLAVEFAIQRITWLTLELSVQPKHQ